MSDKWRILIVLFLGGMRILRFNELKKKLYGVSAKILSERLKYLEQERYITRKMYAEVPVKVEYQLTPLGYQYLEQLLNLTEWVKRVMEKVK